MEICNRGQLNTLQDEMTVLRLQTILHMIYL